MTLGELEPFAATRFVHISCEGSGGGCKFRVLSIKPAIASFGAAETLRSLRGRHSSPHCDILSAIVRKRSPVATPRFQVIGSVMPMDDEQDRTTTAWLDIAGIAAIVASGVLAAVAFAMGNLAIIAAAAALPASFALLRPAVADGDLARVRAYAARTACRVRIGADFKAAAPSPSRALV